MQQIRTNLDRNITKQYTKALLKYYSDISKFPKLTPEEEYEIVVKAKNGDEKAKEKLIQSNLRFVISIAKKYDNNEGYLLDLINEGNIGLITAFDKFDPSSGFKFISYAVWWIRAKIEDYRKTVSSIIDIPINKSTLVIKLKKTSIEMEQELERTPDIDEIMEYLKINKTSSEAVLIRQLYTHNIKSLDEELNDDGITLKDIIPIDKTDYEGKKEIDEVIQRKMKAHLTEKEIDIINSSYGIDKLNSEDIYSISKRYNRTHQNIRYIKEKTLKKLNELISHSIQE